MAVVEQLMCVDFKNCENCYWLLEHCESTEENLSQQLQQPV
jgi:hypothetical protein